MPFVPAQGRSKAADFGTLLGTGVGSGINEQISQNLHRLAQQKMQTMQRKQQAGAWQALLGLSADKAYELTALPYETQLSLLENPSVLARLRGQQGPQQGFNAQQMNPNQAQFQPQRPMNPLESLNLMGRMPQTSPEMFGQMLYNQQQSQMPNAQQEMPQEMQQQMGMPQAAPEFPEQLNLRTRPKAESALDQQIKQERLKAMQTTKGLNPLQEEQLKATQEKRKNEESERILQLKTKRATLEDFVETAKRARKNLASGKASFANPLYAALTTNPYTSGLAPKETESFATDASHLYNLKTEGLKGIMSATRLKNLLADKPGVGRSKDENMKIVNNYISQGEQALADFDKAYPEAKEKAQEASAEEGDIHTYEGPIRGTVEKPELWDPELKMYRPAKKRA